MQGAARVAAEAPGREAQREREAYEAALAAAEEAEAGSGGTLHDPTLWLALAPHNAKVLATALHKGHNAEVALAKSGAIKGFTMQWVELIAQFEGEGEFNTSLGMAKGLHKCAAAIEATTGEHGRCKFRLDYLADDGIGGKDLLLSEGVEICWGKSQHLAGKVFWTYPYCTRYV
jgi:hypothetical protein